MDDFRKLPRCRKCGKKLREISSWEAVIPLEVVLHALPSSVHPSSLRHFECPDRHGGVVLIPAMRDEEREREMKKRKHDVVN
jgi:hypothetical protein